MTADVVVIKDVWVHYDSIPVLEEINLVIKEHDFLGIIGVNGGGKSTLLKVILGLIKPSKGTVRVFGDMPQISRKYIGYVPQYSLFDLEFPVSVWEVVLMGRLGHTGMFKRYSEDDKKAALDALAKMDMLEYKERQVGKLSGGQQHRVFIARALAANPKLLLLDEPAAGIDTIIQEEFYELLEKLKTKMAIVLVSHDISAVSVYVDKIACLNHRLYYHDSKELTAEDLEATYHCPVELIAHGVPHRVLKKH
ncbi:MAG: ABC transporter ATP-binding protein [ANME-2 cluster archaeon]|nr:ABC transporter ATP-binding protein [ANME-2 cluster archaeon]MBC2701849.1 ABC transporter ATP-binding protein [ANME-2 cluster archaeon]MBC2707314.1 ABC transporter ATP-binding protein [ANME-2 cluster archaeon]MBC2747173.1 ABC transporter ATP-binding protein [ANME-2 cluster archaeon]MBC2761723.1 ABC transporter ATP-binding protein [ANME-2 cluster archaeon]